MSNAGSSMSCDQTDSIIDVSFAMTFYSHGRQYVFIEYHILHCSVDKNWKTVACGVIWASFMVFSLSFLLKWMWLYTHIHVLHYSKSWQYLKFAETLTESSKLNVTRAMCESVEILVYHAKSSDFIWFIHNLVRFFKMKQVYMLSKGDFIWSKIL